MAGSTLEAVRSDPDAIKIRETCSPCNYFQREEIECRLLQLQTTWFLKIFEGKRCRPREYLEGFLLTILSRRYGSIDAARPDAEDLASNVVLSLHEKPPENAFCTHDLTGLRRFLAARAKQADYDHRRKSEGRVRCGNCAYHRLRSGGKRICDYPDFEHPWSGRIVKASVDPRTFDPVCKTYKSKRQFESGNQDHDPLQNIMDPRELPNVAATMQEKQQILLECLRAVQMRDPKLSFVIQMIFFAQKTNEEAAKELDCSVKSVIRYKSKALSMLQEELQKRGISGAEEIL